MFSSIKKKQDAEDDFDDILGVVASSSTPSSASLSPPPTYVPSFRHDPSHHPPIPPRRELNLNFGSPTILQQSEDQVTTSRSTPPLLLSSSRTAGFRTLNSSCPLGGKTPSTDATMRARSPLTPEEVVDLRPSMEARIGIAIGPQFVGFKPRHDGPLPVWYCFVDLETGKEVYRWKTDGGERTGMPYGVQTKLWKDEDESEGREGKANVESLSDWRIVTFSRDPDQRTGKFSDAHAERELFSGQPIRWAREHVPGSRDHVAVYLKPRFMSSCICYAGRKVWEDHQQTTESSFVHLFDQISGDQIAGSVFSGGFIVGGCSTLIHPNSLWFDVHQRNPEHCGFIRKWDFEREKITLTSSQYCTVDNDHRLILSSCHRSCYVAEKDCIATGADVVILLDCRTGQQVAASPMGETSNPYSRRRDFRSFDVLSPDRIVVGNTSGDICLWDMRFPTRWVVYEKKFSEPHHGGSPVNFIEASGNEEERTFAAIGVPKNSVSYWRISGWQLKQLWTLQLGVERFNQFRFFRENRDD